jgi:putative transposase
LAALIAALFAQHRGTYGAPRITADVRELGWRVSQNTIASIMAEQGLKARAPRRHRSTTRPGKGRWRAPDLIGRDFSAARVNQRWFGDGTEIDTAEGKLALASVLDMCSRRPFSLLLCSDHL